MIAKKQKLIVILGPTSSGKSDLAVKIAKKFNGTIISADSRQVYTGMDIGTGKITKKEMQGIPHYLLDIASPKRRFSVAQYQKKTLEAINKIYKKGKVPILCGGTGFYIQAIVDNLIIPKVKPDLKLRARLEKFSTGKLFEQLKEVDSKRAKNIDKHNRRRLIRALEIVIKTNKPIPSLKTKSEFNVLMIGIKKSQKELQKLIKKRLLKRLQDGMVKEVKSLCKAGLSWRRLEEFGLEYRWVAYYLQKKISYQEMVKTLQKKIEQYAKRQITWFKRDKRIRWIKKKSEAINLTHDFLSL